jgi:tRNA(Ile2) C34 agmatinyltransferase TiaS
MSNPTCDRCGGAVENKNTAGHYRDKCWDCIEAVAYSPGDDED